MTNDPDSLMASPDLTDYIHFFEAEPEWTDPQGWWYGARFRVTQGVDELVMTIAPDEAELEAVWCQGGLRKLSIVLKGVLEWRLELRDDAHRLLVRVNTGPEATAGFEYCLFAIRPRIEVDCRMSWGSGWHPGEPAPGFLQQP